MENVARVKPGAQVSFSPDIHSEQKRGVEIVRSADVSRSRYAGPRRGRRPIRSETELSAQDRLMVLRGQLRLLRLRAQAGLPVSAAAIGRAERLAISLEALAESAMPLFSGVRR